ncbi:MAG: hypothetical protein A3C93_05165 [Candidatus Lloydbacteria bacterium RIFCSPHIGHO2_02_FULL_54_17]|uniref:Restriction endonuclease type IV Mrr domain-containing protein n=1 Tax=Candidatus Lloydbacteria bacterium RIFCSPHIGHO2_02_FULL_54_17 TaxID=1798664 RepID=A0A1G2DD02_9BACT|nr:MAG: hypothetical protein A2762_05880 [Candidatus Lloydbacteria bacterium RIFCSPHIGHO2_01_FULL_54_11]OGZ11302.1 MAG: hypothetical protein A3C93_05165 [Candidatus Lloydbacteria bacterium RIFCSPHIGHO2_02_FULL_54_17]
MKLVDPIAFFKVFGPLLLGLLVFVAIAIALTYFFKVALPDYFSRKKVKKSFESGEEWRGDQEWLDHLRKMDPTEFEEFIAQLFRSLGYNARAVGHAGDHGVDVEAEKDGVTHLVQCKKYSKTNKVGEPEVRNFLGAIDHQHSRGKGYFVTTGYFTSEAEKFAEDKPIELIDGPNLIERIRSLKKEASENSVSGV